MKIAVVLGIAAAVPLQSRAMPEKFDLTCTGIEHGMDVNGRYTAGDMKPPNIRFRVNLITRQWCSGTCKAIGQVELREGTVYLVWGKSGVLPTSTAFEWPAERVTTLRIHPAKYGEVTGISKHSCKPLKFSGM